MANVRLNSYWFVTKDMFQRAVMRGYSLDRLAYVFLNSRYGQDVLCEIKMSEYSDGLFMLSGFEREFDLGKSCDDKYQYDDYIAGCCGFFYKYWYDNGMTDTKKIYELAKPEIIYQHFRDLDGVWYDYWVKYLIGKEK